jgi:hypothetical protein
MNRSEYDQPTEIWHAIFHFYKVYPNTNGWKRKLIAAIALELLPLQSRTDCNAIALDLKIALGILEKQEAADVLFRFFPW